MRPSRMIVIESEICSISLSLWEIMIEVIPLRRSPSSRVSRCWESASLSAAVGSSRISSLTSLARALAISTSCCLPMPMFLISVEGSSDRPTRASSSLARLLRREPVDHAAVGVLVAEEEVLHDAQLGDERQLLVDDDDAGALALADAVEPALLVLEDDLALVGAVRVDPGQDLHQGRLAGAVLPADRVDLTPFDVDRDVGERLDAGELLGDRPHREDQVFHTHVPLRAVQMVRAGPSARVARDGPLDRRRATRVSYRLVC